MTLDPYAEQHLVEARNRAGDYLRDPIMEFFIGELALDANPADSLPGLLFCISENIATIVKVLDLKRETCTNEELAENFADIFRMSLLAALNAGSAERTSHAVD